MIILKVTKNSEITVTGDTKVKLSHKVSQFLTNILIKLPEIISWCNWRFSIIKSEKKSGENYLRIRNKTFDS